MLGEIIFFVIIIKSQVKAVKVKLKSIVFI